MTNSSSTICEPVAFVIRKDYQAIRHTLKLVRHSYHFTSLCLFGRRNTRRSLEYLERRSHSRDPVQMPLYVTPVTFDGTRAVAREGEPCDLFAMTKDVSLRGVGFTHDHWLEAEHAIVAFDLLESAAVTLLLSLRWTNLRRGDLYLSGGRFLGVAEQVTPDLPAG